MTSTPLLVAETARSRTEDAQHLRVLGWVGLVGSLLGTGLAGVVLGWPASVTTDRYSFPFSATAYVVAHVFFAVQHLTLLALVAGLAVRARHPQAASPPPRLLGGGLVLTALGFLGLTACELFGVTAAHASATSAAATAVNNAYGVPMAVFGFGLLVAGVPAARRRVLPGRSRWLPLICGVYVFVVLFPAVFGPAVAGRLAIGAWQLLFAALGLTLVRLGTDPHGTGGPSMTTAASAAQTTQQVS
jgi:hypothetical protein